MKNIPKHFRLSPRGAMLAVVSAAFANPALANTGKVDFATGNITVTGSDGRGRPLVKGAEVKTGDKIASSANGRAQIRFSDGAYVSLQPNTEFDIRDYRFNGKADGSESALFGLLKGALRTVTGLVGRSDRSRYQIGTPTATIGIRGTGGLISIGGDGSTLVTGSSGVWTLTNQGGTLEIPAGTAGLAGPNLKVPPKPVTQGPVVPPPQGAPQVQPTIVQGDVVNASGDPASLGGTKVLVSGSGYAVAYFGATTTPFAGPTVTSPTNADFDGAGLMNQFNGFAATGAPTLFTLAGTQSEAGTDGVLAWGRWTGNVLANGVSVGTLTANQGLHYVTGLPTPTLPVGGTFTFNVVIGATNPTFGNGSAAPGVLNSASLTGDFGQHTITAGVSVTAGGNTFSGSANGTFGTSTFSGLTGTLPPQLGCSGGCTLNVNGFFSGAGASQAGFVYQFGNVTQGGSTTLNGAVAVR